MSRLAQLVERKTLNLVVVGSSPTVGVVFWAHCARIFLFCVAAQKNQRSDVCVALDTTVVGVLAQSEARVLSKDEVRGSKP